MPYVNVKIVKDQVSKAQKKQIIEGITDLIVNVMHRDRSLTVINIDELNADQWAIGGKSLEDESNKNRNVSFINIKVSKGTTNPAEMEKMMQESKKLMSKILGNYDKVNYFIMDELNPDGWGFDGISMTTRNKLENE